MRAAVVDAFAAQAFSGNPAAVVLVPADAPAPTLGWMQLVAAEFNLSETAFVIHVVTDRFALRWFTPTLEVDLCGHATLAAAHWLMEQGLGGDKIDFDTVSGRLSATRGDDTGGVGGLRAGGPNAAARADGIDVLSRYFAPAIGIYEDPVTGSAHGGLATFWCPRLGRRWFRAAQLSARGGLLDVRPNDLGEDADHARVYITGVATTVMDVSLRW